ncbi:MAG: barstar family protein [Nitrospira sp.]
MTHPQTLVAYLQTPKAPWSSLLIVPPGTTAAALAKAPPGFILRVIHGKKCGTVSGLLDEFARAMEFPDYFGHNWDAMEECLADLEWLPAKGYVLVIVDAHAVLPKDEDEEEYETLLEILSDAGEAWSTGQAGGGAKAIAFHTLFAVSGQDHRARKHWGIEPVPSATPQRVTATKPSKANRPTGRKKSPRS